MWRYVSRGFFQQGCKRSLCIEKPASHIKDGKKSQHQCCIKELLPSAFQKLNFSKCQENQKEDHEETSGNISHHSFLEAFGWSGALVFGWIISKQIWLRHVWSQDQDSITKRAVFDHYSIPLLSHIVKTQPPAAFVLPQLQSSPGDNVGKQPDLEDEFEIAASELKAVHEKAIGQALNRRGIACLSKSTGSEAIKYFKQASTLKYPPASFNMGQCCELGVGTKQDFKQAAEWYKIASDQGHPTAMYNLGVFYAHGWGGLTADIDTARKLFTKAAMLGQLDAKAALDKESMSSSNLIYETSSSIDFIKNYETKPSDFNILISNIRNGLGDNMLQKGFATESKWDVPLASTVPVAV